MKKYISSCEKLQQRYQLQHEKKIQSILGGISFIRNYSFYTIRHTMYKFFTIILSNFSFPKHFNRLIKSFSDILDFLQAQQFSITFRSCDFDDQSSRIWMALSASHFLFISAVWQGAESCCMIVALLHVLPCLASVSHPGC